MVTLAVMSAILLAGVASAQTTYTSNSSGDWDTATRWTPNGIPVAGDTVIIADTHTITLDAAAAAAVVTINDRAAASTALALNGFALNVNDGGLVANTAISIGNNATLNATNSPINVTGTGNHTLTIGIVAGTAATFIHTGNVYTANNTGTVTVNRRSTGTITFGTGSAMILTANVTNLLVPGSQLFLRTLEIRAPGIALDLTSVTISNGLLHIRAGFTVSVAPQWDGAATLTYDLLAPGSVNVGPEWNSLVRNVNVVQGTTVTAFSAANYAVSQTTTVTGTLNLIGIGANSFTTGTLIIGSLANPATPGSVTGPNGGTMQINSILFPALAIGQGGTLTASASASLNTVSLDSAGVLTAPASITGNFTVAGGNARFRSTSNTTAAGANSNFNRNVTFDSGATFAHNNGRFVFSKGLDDQRFTVSSPQTFFDMEVTSGTTLVEVVQAENVTLVGGSPINNQGRIRKTKTISATGNVFFGLTAAAIQFNNLGSPPITQMRITRIDPNPLFPDPPPNKPLEINDDQHWEITRNDDADGFNFNVKLGFNSSPYIAVNPTNIVHACRFYEVPGQWNCGRQGVASEGPTGPQSVQRVFRTGQGVAQFDDYTDDLNLLGSRWTLGGGIDPLFIDLTDFTAAVDLTGSSVAVNWTTGEEVDNAGFHIYRAVGTDANALTGERLTATLLPTAGGPSGGASYTFTDSVPVAVGEVRGYFLEDIDLNGLSTIHGPFFASDARSSVKGWDRY